MSAPSTTATSRFKIVTWVLLISILVFSVYYFSPPAQMLRHARQFVGKTKKSVNPEDLRSWAVGLFESNAISQTPNALPSYIASLDSSQPRVVPWPTNSNGPQAYVSLIYGGGFFHWGMTIGPTNYVEQPYPQYTVIQWVPGIYFKYEGRR